MKKEDNPLWVERYRPDRIKDIILPDRVKKEFTEMVRKKDLPVNLLFTGSPGVGKTTVAQALVSEIGADCITLNGSLHGKIETLRTLVTEFASAVSFTGGRKFVIIDEADYLTNATQPALRQFMEEYSSNCGFILTCNYVDRIIEPLRGRCAVYEFKIDPKEKTALKAAYYFFIRKILDAENVKYDEKTVAYVMDNYFPDLRRTINQLQAYSNGGPIDSGILTKLKDASIDSLISHMRERNYTGVRKWVAENVTDYAAVYRQFYDSGREHFKPAAVPQLVVHLGTYQYRAAFAADPEINLSACLAEIMMSCEFK